MNTVLKWEWHVKRMSDNRLERSMEPDKKEDLENVKPRSNVLNFLLNNAEQKFSVKG